MCFSCNSFLVYHSVLTNYTVSCLASCPLFFFSAHAGFPSFSAKASLSPDRLAGDKTWSLGGERDIWEQDGKGDGGQIPTWSPSSGSVETVVTRRWVILSASSCAAPVEQVMFRFCSRQGTISNSWLHLLWIFGFESLTWWHLFMKKTSLSVANCRIKTANIYLLMH